MHLSFVKEKSGAEKCNEGCHHWYFSRLHCYQMSHYDYDEQQFNAVLNWSDVEQCFWNPILYTTPFDGFNGCNGYVKIYPGIFRKLQEFLGISWKVLEFQNIVKIVQEFLDFFFKITRFSKEDTSIIYRLPPFQWLIWRSLFLSSASSSLGPGRPSAGWA